LYYKEFDTEVYFISFIVFHQYVRVWFNRVLSKTESTYLEKNKSVNIVIYHIWFVIFVIHTFYVKVYFLLIQNPNWIIKKSLYWLFTHLLCCLPLSSLPQRTTGRPELPLNQRSLTIRVVNYHTCKNTHYHEALKKKRCFWLLWWKKPYWIHSYTYAQ